MAIYGTYHCDECDRQFKGWRESDGPYPDCPTCNFGGSWAPQAPTIRGPEARARAKAIDMAQDIAEKDYGMTDINDNQRAGDIAAVAPTQIQTAEADAITREVMAASNAPPAVAEHLKGWVQNYFGATMPTGQGPTMDTLAQIQGAAPAAAEARAAGVDPVGLLSQAKGHGVGIQNIRPVAACDENGAERAVR